jgi:hypothetical protein
MTFSFLLYTSTYIPSHFDSLQIALQYIQPWSTYDTNSTSIQTKPSSYTSLDSTPVLNLSLKTYRYKICTMTYV